MLTAFAILGVLAALFLAAALATRESEGLAPAEPDAADLALPTGSLAADDVRGLRFGLSPRGYRMSEVDAVLERLAGDLEARDRRIAELESAGRPETAPQVEAPVVVQTPVVVQAPAVDDAPAAPPTDAAFSAGADDLDFPEVSLPDVDQDDPVDQAAPLDQGTAVDQGTAAGPDLSVGQVPVEPVDPPLRSS